MKLKRFFILMTILIFSIVPAYAKNLDKEYETALNQLQAGNYADAAQSFSSLGFYEDASLMAMYCAALNFGESGLYATAVGNFESLGDFRDSALQAKYYAALFYEETEKYEDAYELLDTMTLFRDTSARVTTYPAKILARDYRGAEEKETAGNLEGALSAFTALIPYSDSADRAVVVQEKIYARDYANADAMEIAGDLENALSAFKALGNYSDSPTRVTGVEEKIRQRDYAAADKAEQDGDYAAALTGFTALGDYLDSAQRAANVQDKGNYALGLQHANSGNFSEAYNIFAALGNYEDSAEKAYALGVTTFASVSNRYNSVAAFEFHDQWGIINLNTNIAISPYWDEIGYFNEHGLAKVKKDSMYGYINTNGQVVVPCQWYEVSEYKNGFCTVVSTVDIPGGNKYGYTNYVYGLYDAKGNEVTPAQWRTLGQSSAKWITGYYDINYCNIHVPEFSDGMIRVENTAGLWGFMDSQGNMIIVPQYDESLPFSEGLAAVRVGDYWRYIDRDNNVVISANYTQANSFSGGRTDVFLEGVGWQIINNHGSLLYFINEQIVEDYNAAVALMENGKFLAARELFLSLPGYRDSNEQAEICVEKQFEVDYNTAVALKNVGKYSDAITAFAAIKAYKDSTEQIEACETAILEGKYEAAVELKNVGKYSEAIAAFAAIKTYKDSTEQIKSCETTILDGKYDAAVELMDASKYKEAYDAFVALNGYKDSISQANTILSEHQTVKWQNAKVGAYITFGTYEQDNKTFNGKEAIEWLVLAKENNRLLVISRYALDCKPFNTQYSNVTWETCTLRTWLNKDFFNVAFSSDEQKMIPTVTVPADKNPSYSTDPGKATQDKVFLLSIAEASKYLKMDSARQCKPTDYAKVKGASTNSGGWCWWWVRSSGLGQLRTAYVSDSGDIYSVGDFVDSAIDAVRPALWIDLEP